MLMPDVRLGLLDHRGSFLDVFEVRQLEVAGRVFDRGGTEAGGDQVGRGDVADRARGLGDRRGDAGVAFGTDTGLEADGGGDANFGFPGGADLRQVVGERVGVTGTVGTEDRGDGQVRQLRLRVQLGDLRVVPVGDLAEVDAGEDLAGLRFSFLTPGTLKPMPVAERAHGIVAQPPQAPACSAVIGASDAPMSTVPFETCLMPSPEPTARVFDRDAFFDFEAVDPVGEQRAGPGSNPRR